MSGTNINQEISSRVESFVQDLAELIRAAALESVREALGGGAAPAPAARPAKPTRKKKAAKRKGARSGKRVRRSAEEVEFLAQAVEAVVLAKPGIGLGAIARDLGEDVKEIRRPTQILMTSGRLRSEGERRGTKYFPGGSTKGRGRKATKRKATKKRKAGKKRAKR